MRAISKTYIIVKDGERIKTVKNFKDAKETADTEQGEVFCNGNRIYPEESAKYILKALMNVRNQPNGEIIACVKEGTVVDVFEIKDDWMKVRWDDGFACVLYGNGQYADRK